MIDSRIHEAGEEILLPRRFAELGSWRIAAELIRRHPDELVVIETHPADGQYDCLSIYREGESEGHPSVELFLHMNRAGKGHVNAYVPTGNERVRPNWLDVAMSTDLRNQIVVEIERDRGIDSPSKTPSTTSRSIGPRLIAEMLSIQVHHGVALTALNGMEDSSGMFGSGVRTELFAAIPAMTSLMNDRQDEDAFGNPAYRFWFVLRDDHRSGPFIGIDMNQGLVWTKNLEGADLMKMYDESGRNVVRLATRILES